MSGLYVDGVFEGSVASRTELEAILNEIKSRHLTGEGEERAEFIQDVEIVDGLYPVSSLLSIEEMSGKLNTETVTAAYYTVVKGDTLGRIAGKNNMTLSELKEMNPEAEELIHIGDPVPGAASPVLSAGSGGQDHPVQRGYRLRYRETGGRFQIYHL